jgi:hypothetical protein
MDKFHEFFNWPSYFIGRNWQLTKLWVQVGSIPSHRLQEIKMLSMKGTNRMLDKVKYEINVEMSSGHYMYRKF